MTGTQRTGIVPVRCFSSTSNPERRHEKMK